MSKTVNCRECNTPNSVGSKFCNNCGARLPVSTNILCPNCQTPNPRNRLYCDNCGTRLVPDESAKPKKQEGKAEESPTSPKMFSLPTRKPGDTGELDPNAVPDWLKTGQTGALHLPGERSKTASQPPSQSDKEKLPRPDQLTSGKKQTSDLPDWLVDTNSDELFEKAPREITTEHFLDLVNRSDEDDGGFFVDDDTIISGAGANLPDWLTDVKEPPPPAAEMPTIQTGQFSEGVPDWLKEIGPSTPPEKKPEKPTFQPKKPVKSETAELSEWLTELGPPNTDILSPPKQEASGLYTKELPDWMDELGPPNTDILSPIKEEEEDLFGAGWMDELGEPDSNLWPATREETATETAESDLDWLSETESAQSLPIEEQDFDWLQTETPVDETTAVDGQDEDLDWLQAETILNEQPADAGDQVWESSQDWLQAEETFVGQPVQAVEEKDDLDWLMEETAETAPAEPPMAERSPTATEATWADDFDWLAEEHSTEAAHVEPVVEKETYTTGLPEESGEEEDFDDWLKKQSGILNEPIKPEMVDSGPLPTWLMGLEETAVHKELDDGLDDFFASESTDAASSLGWLTGNLESPPPAGEDLFAFDPFEPSAEESVALDAEPDWLSEFDSGHKKPAETAESSFEPSLITEPTTFEGHDLATGGAFIFATDEEETEPIEAEIPAEVEPPQEVEFIEEALPDWFKELGPRSTSTPSPLLPMVEESNLIPSDEMPDWVARMKPGSDMAGSALPSALSSPSLAAEPFDDIPGEFSGAELPEWLEDIPRTSTAPQMKSPPQESGSEILEWLEPEEELDKQSGKASVFATDETSTGSDWSSLLRDLPPPSSRPLTDQLVRADIPEWVQALKPKELAGGVKTETEGRLESSGPLMGLRGVIEVEPVVAMPRTGGLVGALTVTKEQEQQAVLLRQLAREVVPSGSVTGKQPKDFSHTWVQLALAILLIGVILVGLLVPPLFTADLPVAPGAEAAHTAVMAAAGEPVLVAFEYTPAMAGELNLQATALLETLAANDSPVLTVSQFTAGTAVALQQTANYTTYPLNLVPGEAVGLRQLAGCLVNEAICIQLPGYSMDADLTDMLQNVSLVIVLTGNRESLLDWIEQVQSSTGKPVVAGITQSLGPVAAPYLASGQLQGVITGLPGTAVYRQAAQSPDETVLKQLYVQRLAQLLSVGLLVTGGFYYGTKAAVSRRKR